MAIAKAELIELRFKILLYIPYSPRLASFGFFLFTNKKKWLHDKRFSYIEKVITETDAYFYVIHWLYYSNEIKPLEYRWNKIIELKEKVNFSEIYC